jgi:hypothetical protein
MGTTNNERNEEISIYKASTGGPQLLYIIYSHPPIRLSHAVFGHFYTAGEKTF